MNYIPVRKITNIGTKKNTGIVPSIKNNRSIAYESLLERDYIYLFEYDDDVISYTEQPVTIKYIYKNKSCRYTPDFFVVRKNKKQLIEIKPYEKIQEILSEERKSIKFYFADKYCSNNDINEFIISTERDINSCLLENIKFLFAFSRLTVPPSAKLEIRNRIILNRLIEVNDLLEILPKKFDSRTYYSYILSMLYSKDIKTNLKWPINRKSLLWI